MTANQVVLHHLNAARAELEAQRDAAEAGIRDIDELLRRYGVEASAVSQPSTPRSHDRTIAAAEVLKFMSEYKHPDVPAMEIVSHLQVLGSSDNATRSQLAKMTKARSIIRVGRGMYRLPTDSKAPVAAGALDGEKSEQTDSSRKEGGTARDTVPLGGRDRDSGDAGLNHGHSEGASITEALTL